MEIFAPFHRNNGAEVRRFRLSVAQCDEAHVWTDAQHNALSLFAVDGSVPTRTEITNLYFHSRKRVARPPIMWEVASPLIRYALELAARNVVRIVSERGANHSRILEGLVVCGGG